MTIEELIDTKKFVKENSSIEFKPVRDYVNPFVDIVGGLTKEFRVTVQNKIVNENEGDGTRNVSYGRFMVEAILTDDFIVEESETTIGLIVAMDNSRPVMKTFAGKNVLACTNLTIFNAEHVFTQDMLGNVPSLYSKVKEYYGGISDSLGEYQRIVTALKERSYEGSNLEQMMGKILKGSFQSPALGHSVAVQGLRELFNDKSIYRAVNNRTSAWNIYNSITEVIKKTDVIDRANKTIALSNIILN